MNGLTGLGEFVNRHTGFPGYVAEQMLGMLVFFLVVGVVLIRRDRPPPACRVR